MDGTALDLLARPGLLPFALPLVLWIVVLALVARSRLRGPVFWSATALRCTIALALLWFLAGPGTPFEEKLPARLEVHVDLSRSVSPAARDAALDVLEARLNELVLAERAPAVLDLFAFAGRARLVWSGEPAGFAVGRAALADQAAELEPMASDLEASLKLGRARRQADEGLARIVVSDGSLPRPRRSDRAGPCQLVPPVAAAERNLRLVDLGLPERVEVGAEIEAVLGWSATGEGKVEVAITLEDRPLKTIELEHGAGSGELVFALDEAALEPGRHRLHARALTADDEPADDLVGALLEVRPRRRPLVVTTAAGEGESRPVVLRALEAQAAEPRSGAPSDLVASGVLERSDLVVLDRVGAEEIDAEAAAAIIDFVERGGGLVVLPRERRDDLLAWNGHALADLLPLAGLPEPQIPPDEEPERPEKDEADRKLSDPDPEASEEKEIDAPTLILLLVIDASASMKEGARVVYARQGAIATLRKLHPEDRIGVIAYNDRASEVVPVQPVANAEEIERAIQRIEPDGATDIETALLFAQTTLERESAAVKMIVLLSDGYSRPFNVKEVARGLLAAGISVTTVGVGSQFDVALLTQIAKYSGGTGPIPARNARQLPAVMVDVAARLIDRKSLRRAPEKEPDPVEDEISRPETRLDPPRDHEPRPGAEPAETETRLVLETARPSSFLDGIVIAEAPPLGGIHRSQLKRGATLSLKLEDDRPALAYWRRGDGVVAMASLPLDGAWAARFSLWDSFSPLLAQLYRFAARDPGRRDVEIAAASLDGRALVEIFDSRRRDAATGWRFRAGEDLLDARELEEGRYLVEIPVGLDGPLLVLDALDPGDGTPFSFGLTLEPPSELRDRGLDLAGLSAWAEALGGRVVAAPGGELAPPPSTRRLRVPAAHELALLLAGIALFELALKRLVASRSIGS